MFGIDHFIVALWFLPVVLFIVVPLVMTCFGFLFSLLDVFRPVAGQGRSAIKNASRVKAAAAA